MPLYTVQHNDEPKGDISYNISVENRKNIMNDFKHFLEENKIAGTAAGVIIAYSAKDLVESFVNNVIFPLLSMLFISIGMKHTAKYYFNNEKIHMSNFMKKTLTFIILIVSTYFILRYLFQNIIERFTITL